MPQLRRSGRSAENALSTVSAATDGAFGSTGRPSTRPDGYEWCSYAAACRGDETARSGYDFVYGGKGRPWSELKELHDISIRQMLKERELKDSEDVELARANKRPDRRGKAYAAGIEMPGYILQVVAKGDNVRAVRLMQLLQWEPKSPAYLRTTLGVASRCGGRSWKLHLGAAGGVAGGGTPALPVRRAELEAPHPWGVSGTIAW